MGTLVEIYQDFCKYILNIIDYYVKEIQFLFFDGSNLSVFGYLCIFLIVAFLFVGLLLFVRDKLQFR